MSFQGSFPRTFSAGSIRTHAPAASGVFGISNGREWILIEAADNIQADLLRYAGAAGSVAALHPTGFAYEVCDRSTLEWRRDALVKKYVPVYTSTEVSRRGVE